MKYATTADLRGPAPDPPAPDQPRWSRFVWGRPPSVERAWIGFAVGQVAAACSAYLAWQQSGAWAVVAAAAAVLAEVTAVGRVVLAYRHRSTPGR